MQVLRPLAAILPMLALSWSSSGQESEAPSAEAAPADAPPAASAEAPPAAPDTRPLDEIFIPTQEIGADEEVTFPVNI
jgi:hypothetical protein